MSKLKVSTTLKGPDENFEFTGLGILKDDNTIIYKQKDITTNIKINDNTVEILRRCNEYRLELFFREKDKTSGVYVLLINKLLAFPIYTNKLIITENSIDMEYTIDEIGDFTYKLNYEVIE